MGDDICAIAGVIEPYVKSDSSIAMLLAEAFINLRFLASATLDSDSRKHLPSNVIHEFMLQNDSNS